MVYFHQISNKTKLLVEQRCKNVVEQKKEKKYIAPHDDDDDGAIVHCSMANSVQAPEKLTAERKLKQMRTQFKPTEGDPSIYA